MLSRVQRAAKAAGREPDDVTLVVITKTWPASDVALLHDLGVRHVGENRQQELSEKAAALAGLDLQWHFVGQLQSNKAAKIALEAHWVHSVDAEKTVGKLDGGAERADRILDCLVQVNLDPPTAGPGRGGVDGRDVGTVADAIRAAGHLRLRGVMGVAPLGRDPAPAYARLAQIGRRLAAQHPAADVLSAGMSGDLEAAVAAGATHVRVGSAVLGARPPLR